MATITPFTINVSDAAARGPPAPASPSTVLPAKSIRRWSARPDQRLCPAAPSPGC